MYNKLKEVRKMLLIISRNKRNASALSDTFYYMSLLSFPATPKEALSEISPIYKAALILEPKTFPDIRDFIAKLRSYDKTIPIFAVSKESAEELSDVFQIIFGENDSTPKIASRIINYCEENDYYKPGEYKLAGFDASSDKIGVSYFYYKPKLTKTETMILRYLIATYPVPQNSDSILRHSFRISRIPEAASVRTHISSINKKIHKISGRKIIALSPGRGYFIMTPEILAEKKIM